jgi:hypothetical protein
MATANTLAYYETAKITTVKSHIVQAHCVLIKIQRACTTKRYSRVEF